MFSHLSTSMSRFMEPINGTGYYEDVHRPKIDPLVIEDNGDKCETESDTDSGLSTDGIQVPAPPLKRPTIASRAAAARKSARAEKKSKVDNGKKVGKKDGGKRKVQNVERVVKETSYEDFMEGVQEAAMADSFMPINLVSEDDSLNGDSVLPTTEGDDGQTTTDGNGVDRTRGAQWPHKSTRTGAAAPHAIVVIDSDEIPDTAEVSNEISDDDDENIKGRLRYQICPSKNSRSSIVRPAALQSPFSPEGSAHIPGFFKRFTKLPSSTPDVINLTSSSNETSRARQRGRPYPTTLKPAAQPLSIGPSRSNVLQAALHSDFQPTAPRADGAKRPTMARRGGARMHGVRKVPKARGRSQGAGSVSQAVEAIEKSGDRSQQRGAKKAQGVKHWRWFKNWRGDRWMVEDGAGVVVVSKGA